MFKKRRYRYILLYPNASIDINAKNEREKNALFMTQNKLWEMFRIVLGEEVKVMYNNPWPSADSEHY